RSAGLREDAIEVVGVRHLELVVAAVGRPPVGPPAQERRGVAEAVALEMVVSDLADALDPQRLPRQVLAGAPAALPARHARAAATLRAGPVTPRMRVERVLAQRL